MVSMVSIVPRSVQGLGFNTAAIPGPSPVFPASWHGVRWVPVSGEPGHCAVVRPGQELPRSIAQVETCYAVRDMSFDRFKPFLHRASERLQEVRYGIRTGGWMSEESLGFDHGDGRQSYSALPYVALRRLLSTVVPDPQTDVFVDWGCGM